MRRSKNGPEPSARGNFTPPPRGAAPAHVPGPEPSALPTSGSRFSPRNWRVPTRLNAILLIPVLVGLVMGGFQVKSSIDTWQQAQDAEATARLVQASLSYADALYQERDISAQPLLDKNASGKDKVANEATVKKVRDATDAAAAAFDRAAQNMPHKAGLERRLGIFRDAEKQLPDLRKGAYGAAFPGVKTEETYVAVAHPLMEFANELGLGTGNITSYGRTVYAISLTKAALSLERSIGMHLLVSPGPDPENFGKQRVALSSYAYLEGIAVEEYQGGGTAADARKLQEATVKLKADGTALAQQAAENAKKAGQTYVPPPDDMIQQLATLQAPTPAAVAALAPKGVTPANWWAVNTLKYNAYRQIESDLADKAVSDASGIADDAKQSAFITGGIVVVALLAAFVLAGLMARQMSRSMRQLRNAAFGVAEQRLPMLVDQLSRTDPGRVDTRVAPIPIASTDEIGEVARAFDQVHREAVRLAAEQALLRGNINAIFTNLSRRNQSLIEGQLTLITDLENNEADPDQLENLFRLDHLATRMRRNGENLLVLAGEEPGRRWDQPVPLIDVLRAASSEVEQYERIELSGVPEAEIHGRAVTDLVHLLAELLENATTFSSPQTKVRVTATRLPDGRIMVEIHDKGIGLTAEDFADINHKLANPPTVDAAISQRMGLFVVGRLSDRHGIRVQLRPSGEQAGTTSLVMLPDAITHGGGGEQSLERDEFTVSQIIPEQQFQGENFGSQLPMRTAAELGFDDSQYVEVPDDIRDLDPVGRSLMREERRAALEAQAQGHSRPEEAAEPGPSYQDGFEAQDPSFGNGQHPYEEQPAAYDPSAAYEEQYYAPNGGLPQGDGFPSGGYPEPAFAEPVQDNRAANQGTAPETFPAFDESSYQDDWPKQNEYQSAYRGGYAPDTESLQAADVSEQDRVGFDRPGPAPSAVHDLTDAGLPRRGTTANGGTDRPQPVTPEPSSGTEPAGDWRSANDQRWQQASQVRKPKAGGVTSSGLPRRVPKANLIEGAAETTPQGGPQVSRAPEDVRGRLSNLRRGVQRGRNAGSETNGQGFGPDSTYNQER
ncbi:nitrate- and nitrite sensing domain-containing protein [Streptomyces sp. NPDC093228]|uniref:sensor histidine kinase n=1 Tax=unclassified Streptomyces TaxID=2593676 RepID=UPI000740D764|nr:MULTISPECIES: nitrate- and nitrite sensing domain-containing protein [unclassified Streptomyces]KUJ54709.1 ATPase [Streptomyces sp. NRRL F-5122]MDX3263902.1 nitrate- and nitrite sensing domain-containing protein [Streptomyces sp. MI02-2A]REE63607.1 signal transduction histidine kinase [Streptomyces sp. 3212.3]